MEIRVRIITFLLLFTGSIQPLTAQTDYPLETVLQKGHKDYIRCYDFSADGTLLVTGGYDNSLILWDFKSGKQIRIFTGHTERLRSVVFNKNGTEFMSVAADNRIKVFEVISGKELMDVGREGIDFFNAYYSSNESYFYGLTNRDDIYIWDRKTGRSKGLVKKEYAAHHESRIFSPDEKRVLSVDGYRGSVVLDVLSRDTTLVLPFDKGYSHSFSPDGAFIAISSRKQYSSIFNAETGELLHELRDGDARCDGCNTHHVFSPDSRFLVTMSNKVPAILWDVKSGKKVRSFLESEDRPNQLIFSSKGTYLLIAFGDEVFVYDTKTGRQKLNVKNEFIDYLNFEISEDERFVAFPNELGGIEIWDISRGSKVKTIEGYLNKSDDTKLNLSYSNWVDQAILSYIQHKRKVLIHPNQKSYLIGGIDSVAMLVDIHTGRIMKRFQGHQKSVIAFDFSRDGNYLATAGADRTIIVWDLKGDSILTRLFGHQETIFDLAFSADAQTIISGAWDGSLRIWDWKNGDYEYVLYNNNSPYTVGFSPNELYYVTCDLDKSITFRESDAKEVFRTLVGHTHIISAFDFSPDGKSLVTSSWDGKVKVWDVLTGMLIGRMNKHNGGVYAVKYHPSGNYIASAGADNTIVLWDPSSNVIRAELKGHSTGITSLSINKEGDRLVSISLDGMVKVWDLSSNKLLYTRVQLSRTEWIATSPNGYFDGSPNALDKVNYVKGNQVVNVSNLFEKYYVPGLIESIDKSGGKFNNRSQIEDSEMQELPNLSFALHSQGTRSIVNLDSVLKSSGEYIDLEILIAEHDIPLDEIRLYNNGKLILQQSLEENVKFRGIGEREHLFKVQLTNGENKIKAVIVNSLRTESSPTSIVVEYDGSAVQSDLYIFTIGINDYKNPAYKLDYAVNDAKSFAKSIVKGADSLFNAIHTYSILNADATKENILSKLKEVESQAGPEDVFLFYYAGHGVMSQVEGTDESEFYIVTHDLTNLYDSPENMQKKAISASEIMAISMRVSAEKQLFILDACHSGGAIETFAVRGSEREKALAQLARNTGTFFLTAAQNAEYANEVGKLNHGLFTYALLEILEGSVLVGTDKSITVNELKSYAEERVPELTEEYQGSPQYPTGYSFGRDFPIVIIK